MSAVPFQLIVDDGPKFEPVAVIVVALLPAAAEAGLIEVSVVAGFEIEKVTPLDVPPPGVGFSTVTVMAPPV